MGKPAKQVPVKLIAGLIYKDEGSLEKTLGILRRRFGAIDQRSPAMNFTYTGYYEKEFGRGLKKVFVSFTKLISAEKLAAVKNFTNKIENRLSLKNARQVNIDPGYLTLAKLVLASTKDYSHRIYLDKGIFAEITLSYRGNSFHPLEWTYRDYRTPEYIAIFNNIRNIYAQQVKSE